MAQLQERFCFKAFLQCAVERGEPGPESAAGAAASGTTSAEPGAAAREGPHGEEVAG